MRFHFLRRALFTASLMVVFSSTSALAVEDHDNDAITSWSWWYGLTEAQLTSKLSGGYRIVDLEVDSTSPMKFTAALVKNTGSYARTWWWYYGVSTSTLSNLLSQNNARLIDLEPYESGGQLRYAAVMVKNTGSHAKTWWWHVSTNLTSIVNAVSANGARVVDLEEKSIAGSTWYSVIAIKNSGADAKGWYWWFGVTTSFISSEINSKGLRLIDLERRSDGKYDVVLVKNTENMYWWWYIGQSEAGLWKQINQTGSRVQNIQRVNFSGTPYFYAILNNNSNELTSKVGEILRDGTNGVSGLYLKRVNGSVHASLQAGFVFEPASTIKTLMHVHAMKAVEQGSASLTELLTVWTGSSGSCPQYSSPITENLSTVLKKMMENSDNNRTMAVRDRFGQGNINGTATALGMVDTQIIHTLGCGGPPPNEMTLVDGGILHEAVANGYLTGSNRDTFWNLMLNNVSNYGGGLLGQIIDQEGAALGLPSFEVSAFKANMKMAYKGGSYGYGNPLDFYRSVLAYVRLPFKSGSSIVPREYVTGVFVHDASVDSAAAAALNKASAELLRDVIHDGLATWKSDCTASNSIYGKGKPGTNGVPSLAAKGLPIIGQPSSITVSNGLPGVVSTLFVGFKSAGIPFDNGTLLVSSPLILPIPVPFNKAGEITVGGVIPSAPGICGLKLYHQVMFVDPGAKGYYQTAQTNGLLRTLGI